MSSKEIAIRANTLCKHYRIWNSPSARLRASIWALLKRYDKNYTSSLFRTFKALDGVSFSIRRGESVGIIGRNGAGKSTLLQMIAGTLKPTSGEIQVDGKVAALLELGAGFNPEFSGRENVQINASILGLTQDDIRARTPAIIEYAEIGDFIDQPVKTYSSGMQMRLAFAIAVHVDADIFIIDEALSVGDAWFQLKCAKTMDRLIKSGKTFLLVSHSPIAIKQYCNRAILLDHGKVVEEGDPNHVCNVYSKLVSGISHTRSETPAVRADSLEPEKRDPEPINGSREQRLENIVRKLLTKRINNDITTLQLDEFEYGSVDGRLDGVRVLDEYGHKKSVFLPGETMRLQFSAISYKHIENPVFGLTVKKQTGQEVYIYNTMFAGHYAPDLAPNQTLQLELESELNLMPGDYFLSVGWVYFSGDDINVVHRRYDFEKITILPEDHCAGIANLYSKFRLLDE